MVFLEAALAADLITASKPNPSGEAGLAADLITATPNLIKNHQKSSNIRFFYRDFYRDSASKILAEQIL